MIVVVVLEGVSVELVVLVLLEVRGMIPVVSVARIVHNPMACRVCLVVVVDEEEEVVVVVDRSSMKKKMMPLHFLPSFVCYVLHAPCSCPSSPVCFEYVVNLQVSSRCRRSK